MSRDDRAFGNRIRDPINANTSPEGDQCFKTRQVEGRRMPRSHVKVPVSDSQLNIESKWQYP